MKIKVRGLNSKGNWFIWWKQPKIKLKADASSFACQCIGKCHALNKCGGHGVLTHTIKKTHDVGMMPEFPWAKFKSITVSGNIFSSDWNEFTGLIAV